MRIGISDYEGKGLPLAPFLRAAGHTVVESIVDAEAVFVDLDAPWATDRVEVIEEAVRRGLPVFQYPHGGNPLVGYDGLFEPHPAITAMFVTGPGHRELQESFGHARPVREIGWFLSTVRHQLPVEPRNVLVAPTHPWFSGNRILRRDRDANVAAFDAARSLGLPVTVRHIGDARLNGVGHASNVNLVEVGRTHPAEQVTQIDTHDLVIANGTFAALALARGKPVVMFGQDSMRYGDDGKTEVENWDAYEHLIRYPLDVADAPLQELAQRALDGEGQEWRLRFVGTPCTPERLSTALKEFVDG